MTDRAGRPADPSPTLALEVVDELLAHGHAEPLLLGHFPVPIYYQARWWHLPVNRQHYQPAPPTTASVFDTCRARLRAAARANEPGR